MPPPRIARTVARGKPKPNLRRRAQHLAFVRQLPCVVCGKAAASEAAHVRSGSDGGAGMKPSDRYSVSLELTRGAFAATRYVAAFTFATRVPPPLRLLDIMMSRQ
jgi:hypothetical protein